MHNSDEYRLVRNVGHRFAVAKSDDSGSENYYDLIGMEGFKPTRVLHVQPHGLSSVPPAGGNGLAIPMGGSYDRLAFLGGEHPTYKPKGLGAGGTALYNASGEVIKMVGQSSSIVTGGLTITCGSTVFAITSSGVNITGDLNVKGNIHVTGGNITVNGVVVEVP